MSQRYQYRSDMRFRLKTLSPLFRWIAAAALVIYVTAQAVCLAHCHLGGFRTTQPSCHAKSSHCHRCDSSAPAKADPMPASTCLTLMNAVSSSASLTVVAPELPLLYTLAPDFLALPTTAIEPLAFFSRQARPADWILTPEVFLGPAHRSLAPPFPARLI